MYIYNFSTTAFHLNSLCVSAPSPYFFLNLRSTYNAVHPLKIHKNNKKKTITLIEPSVDLTQPPVSNYERTPAALTTDQLARQNDDQCPCCLVIHLHFCTGLLGPAPVIPLCAELPREIRPKDFRVLLNILQKRGKTSNVFERLIQIVTTRGEKLLCYCAFTKTICGCPLSLGIAKRILPESLDNSPFLPPPLFFPTHTHASRKPID